MTTMPTLCISNRNAAKNLRFIFRLRSPWSNPYLDGPNWELKGREIGMQTVWTYSPARLWLPLLYRTHCSPAVCLPFCTIKIQLSRSLCNPSSKLSLFGYQHFWTNTEMATRTLLFPTMVSYNSSQLRFREFANRIWPLDLNFSAWPEELSKKRENETKWNNLIKFYPDAQIQFLGVTKVSRWHNSILLRRCCRSNCSQGRTFCLALVNVSS